MLTVPLWCQILVILAREYRMLPDTGPLKRTLMLVAGLGYWRAVRDRYRAYCRLCRDLLAVLGSSFYRFQSLMQPLIERKHTHIFTPVQNG